MVIAVTGAAGTVGAFVAEELAAHGHEVVAVDLAEPASGSGTFRRGDVEDLDALSIAFAGCDAIVHLAATREAGIAPPAVTFRINALGTMNALEAAVRVGATRFVLASSEGSSASPTASGSSSPTTSRSTRTIPYVPTTPTGRARSPRRRCAAAAHAAGRSRRSACAPATAGVRAWATRRARRSRTPRITTARCGCTSTCATSPAPTASPARSRASSTRRSTSSRPTSARTCRRPSSWTRFYPWRPAPAAAGRVRRPHRQHPCA